MNDVSTTIQKSTAPTVRSRIAVLVMVSVLLTGLGAGLSGTAGAASSVESAEPTSAPTGAEPRSADKVAPPLNTAVITANTGNMSASVTLWRWTGSAWVKEKTGTTNASGGVTFRYVRGGAWYYWETSKASVRIDANGNLRPCGFYSHSDSDSVWVPRGANRSMPMEHAWNTCGA